MRKRPVTARMAQLPVWVIDVGNSSTSLGWYTSGRIVKRERIPTAELNGAALRDLLKSWRAQQNPRGVVVASVVPKVNDKFLKLTHRLSGVEPLLVNHQLQLGAAITYPQPERIGQDRLANVAGAVARYEIPIIVIDIGTATTFDIIQPRKGYTGGVIAPGPDLMLSYLAEKTSLLPPVELMPIRQAVGKTTEQAMRLGALHGYRGMVKEICLHLMRRLRYQRVTLCATGGYARWVLKGMELPLYYDRDLTLYGLGRIYELNRKE